MPPDDRFFLGDVRQTLPQAANIIQTPAILVHIDMGTTDHTATSQLMATVSRLLVPMVAVNAIIVSHYPLYIDNWNPLPVPPRVKPERCFLYRVQ